MEARSPTSEWMDYRLGLPHLELAHDNSVRSLAVDKIQHPYRLRQRRKRCHGGNVRVVVLEFRIRAKRSHGVNIIVSSVSLCGFDAS